MMFPMQRTRPGACLSDFRIDVLLAGDADDELSSRAHIKNCAECAERFAYIAADRAEFRKNATPLAAPTPHARHALRRWMWPAAGALAAAAAVLLVVGVRGGATSGSEETGIRAKGGERLGFFVKRGGAVTVGASGDVVHPGDAILFTYTSADARHLAIVSVDGASVVSIYFPDGARAARVSAGRDIELPHSIVLDDTLGPETIHALFCDTPVAVAAIRAAFETNRHEPALPRGCTSDRLTLDKRAGP